MAMLTGTDLDDLLGSLRRLEADGHLPRLAAMIPATGPERAAVSAVEALVSDQHRRSTRSRNAFMLQARMFQPVVSDSKYITVTTY